MSTFKRKTRTPKKNLQSHLSLPFCSPPSPTYPRLVLACFAGACAFDALYGAMAQARLWAPCVLPGVRGADGCEIRCAALGAGRCAVACHSGQAGGLWGWGWGWGWGELWPRERNEILQRGCGTLGAVAIRTWNVRFARTYTLSLSHERRGPGHFHVLSRKSQKLQTLFARFSLVSDICGNRVPPGSHASASGKEHPAQLRSGSSAAPQRWSPVPSQWQERRDSGESWVFELLVQENSKEGCWEGS